MCFIVLLTSPKLSLSKKKKKKSPKLFYFKFSLDIKFEIWFQIQYWRVRLFRKKNKKNLYWYFFFSILNCEVGLTSQVSTHLKASNSILGCKLQIAKCQPCYKCLLTLILIPKRQSKNVKVLLFFTFHAIFSLYCLIRVMNHFHSWMVIIFLRILLLYHTMSKAEPRIGPQQKMR